MKKQIKHLEIILKTVERCNINCTYCYFFNGIDKSYLKHPPYISQQTIKNTAQFIRQACNDYNIESVRIDFHGGEPLMQKRDDFDAMCAVFYNTLHDLTSLSFSIQTNAMLINHAWLDLFSKYNVYVGISLDGPKIYNDTFRIDKRNRGTYDRVVTGINKLNEYVNKGLIDLPGVLCVINPTHPAKTIYRHFVDDLKFQNIDFLLPDLTYDAISAIPDFCAKTYGNFLCDIFTEWTRDDNPDVNVRILDSTMSLLIGGQSALSGYGTQQQNFLAMTITSNGQLAPDDTLRSSNPEYMQTNLSVANATLSDFLQLPLMQFLQHSLSIVPIECNNCRWVKICSGGASINRYSQQNLFTNKSLMCAGLIEIYQKVYDYLLTHGLKDKVIIYS